MSFFQRALVNYGAIYDQDQRELKLSIVIARGSHVPVSRLSDAVEAVLRVHGLGAGGGGRGGDGVGVTGRLAHLGARGCLLLP